MRTYTCNNFVGINPVGTAATVRASSPEEAARLLSNELDEAGLPQQIEPEQMEAFDSPFEMVRILNDGDY